MKDEHCSFNFTVFHQWLSTNLNIFFQSNLFILDEAALSEILLAFFLLLGLVVSNIGGVAPLVIGVITLHNIIILSLLNHLYFVNTFLTISTRTSSSYSWEADINIFSSLTSKPTVNSLGWLMCLMMLVMVMMFISSSLCVERKSVNKRFCVPCTSSVSPKFPGTSNTVGKQEYGNKFCKSHFIPRPTGET